MNWHFYHKETGMVHPKVIHSDMADAEIALKFAQRNAPEYHLPIAGKIIDQLSQKVDVVTCAIVDYQPPAPSADHEWNEAVKRWNLNPMVAARDLARTSAAAQIRDLESKAIRALIEQALGHEGAKERLEALHKQITELRPTLQA